MLTVARSCWRCCRCSFFLLICSGSSSSESSLSISGSFPVGSLPVLSSGNPYLDTDRLALPDLVLRNPAVTVVGYALRFAGAHGIDLVFAVRVVIELLVLAL